MLTSFALGLLLQLGLRAQVSALESTPLPVCGTEAGIKCAEGTICVDRKDDHCVPRRGDKDCEGVCVTSCGGTEQLQCPAGNFCTKRNYSTCNPLNPSLNCTGICRPACNLSLNLLCSAGYTCEEYNSPYTDTAGFCRKTFYCEEEGSMGNCPRGHVCTGGECRKRSQQSTLITSASSTTVSMTGGQRSPTTGLSIITDPLLPSTETNGLTQTSPPTSTTSDPIIGTGTDISIQPCPTVCADYVNACGQWYGGCYPACSPAPTFTPPPCTTPSSLRTLPLSNIETLPPVITRSATYIDVPETTSTGGIDEAPDSTFCPTVCVNKVNGCGVAYGGCYPVCEGEPNFTVPPCGATSTESSSYVSALRA